MDAFSTPLNAGLGGFGGAPPMQQNFGAAAANMVSDGFLRSSNSNFAGGRTPQQ